MTYQSGSGGRRSARLRRSKTTSLGEFYHLPLQAQQGNSVGSGRATMLNSMPMCFHCRPLYLIISSIIAIAATGTIFQYLYKSPLFGLLDSGTPLYNVGLGAVVFTSIVRFFPVLAERLCVAHLQIVCGIFVFTGFPVSAYFWNRAIKSAEKDGWS